MPDEKRIPYPPDPKGHVRGRAVADDSSHAALAPEALFLNWIVTSPPLFFKLGGRRHRLQIKLDASHPRVKPSTDGFARTLASPDGKGRAGFNDAFVRELR